ncbi:MFS transporter [Paenibacillus sp. 1P07SE]|uniref:MFS transporter n=1 Tax=Paenibacillus sp. 1P07SE TaxID=3132209 RepID=UPI0039A632D4
MKNPGKLPFSTPIYYGWFILFIAALSVFFSGPGQTFTISIFIDSYVEDFGWSRSLISSLYLGATLLAGSLLFLVGRSIERWGSRTISVMVAIMLAAACFWNSFVAGPIMLFIGFLMLRLFGQGSMMLVPNTLLPQWFIKQRGRAYSLLGVGSFLGFLLFPVTTNWLIETWGWAEAWRVWGLLLLLGFVPLAWLLIRNRPEDVGLKPDSPSARKSKVDTSGAVVADVPEVEWTLQEAFRTRAFWCFLFCITVPALVNTGIIFHLPSIVEAHDISSSAAALSLSVMALVSFPFTFAAGFLNERVKVHLVIGWLFLLQVVSMIILAYTQSYTVLILFSVVRGVVQGFEGVSLNLVWPTYFGKKAIGSIKSLTMTAVVMGSAFGPLPFGLAFDLWGGYTEILLIMTLLPLVAMIAAWLSPPPRKDGA